MFHGQGLYPVAGRFLPESTGKRTHPQIIAAHSEPEPGLGVLPGKHRKVRPSYAFKLV